MALLCPHRMALATSTEPSCGPPLVCSMWITSETGTVHYGCSPSEANARDLLDRYERAGIAIKTEIGECCQHDAVACAFDQGEDDIDAVVMLSYALARAEGRPGSPPYRCACCGHMTYGGCCDRDSRQSGSPEPPEDVEQSGSGSGGDDG